MDEYKKILEENYSFDFDKLRQKMMVTSYYKYGALKDNATNEAYDWEASLKKRIQKYEETKNVEFLADAANFCMMLFMFPEKHGGYYKPTDSKESPGIEGISIREMLDYTE